MGNDKIIYPYVGVPTFLRAPLVTEENKLNEKPFSIGVLGVPFDAGVTYSPGSRFAPRAIREHSLRIGSKGYYDHREKKHYLTDELERSILDFGDVEIIPCDLHNNLRRITTSAKRIIDKDALLIAIGGDHSVSFPLINAYAEKGPIHVIQFDAHADFIPIEPGHEYTNGHPFSHVSQMEHVKSLTQVGIRSIRDDSHLRSISEGNRVIGMDEFYEIGPEGTVQAIPFGEPCYVSIDIDAFDITLTPGCGSAEPDGFTYAELRDTLAAVARRCPVVGFDFVEVAPLMDVRTSLTSYVAMLTIVEFLGKICDQPFWKKILYKGSD